MKEQFTIKTDILEEKIKENPYIKDNLIQLKWKIDFQEIKKFSYITFEKEDNKLYIIDWQEKINIEDKELVSFIESVYEKLKNLKTEIQKNPTISKTEMWEKYVIMHLESYDINVLLWLYKKAENDLKNAIKENIFLRLEKFDISIDEKIILLQKLKEIKSIDEDFYGEAVFIVLKTLSDVEKGEKLINTIWKEDIQKSIKNQVIIDDNFAEKFWFNFKSSDKIKWYLVNCENNDKVACNAFAAYLLAMKDVYKLNNFSVLSEILYKVFNQKLTLFKEWVLQSINEYKEIKWNFPNVDAKTFQKVWLIWLVNQKIDNMLDGTNMTVWQKEWWKAFWKIALTIWAIWWIFQMIKKTWFKWLLGLLGWGVAIEFLTNASSWESFFLDVIPKFLNGWLKMSDKIKKTTKNWIDLANYKQNYNLWKLWFLNMILWDTKIKDLKAYFKDENWKITFNTKEYLNYLKSKDQNDWRIQIINWMWEKNFSVLVEKWFSLMWINTIQKLNNNQFEKVNDIFVKYINTINKQNELSIQKESLSTIIESPENGKNIKDKTIEDKTIKDQSTLVSPKSEEIQQTKNKLKVLPKLEWKKQEIKSTYKTIWYIKDWKYYIIWEDGKNKVFTYELLSEKTKKLFEQYKDTSDFIDDMLFLAQAYDQKENKHLSKEIHHIVEQFLQNQNFDVKKSIEETIKKNIQWVFSEIFSLDKEKRGKEIYNFVRNNLWLYDVVSDKIADDNFDKISNFTDDDIFFIYNEFWKTWKENIVEKIKKANIQDISVYSKIKKFFNSNNDDIKKFIDDMYDNYNKAQKYLLDNHKTIVEQVDSIMKDNNIPEDKRKEVVDQVEKVYKSIVFDLSFKKYILNYYIEKNWTKDNFQLNLYKDIEWIWWLDFSDKTLHFWEELFTIVLTEAIAIVAWTFTVWIWFVTVNSIVWWTRWYKWIKYLQRIYKSSSWIAKSAKITSKTTFEWVLFYEWANTAQNIIEEKNWFEGVGDGKEIVKSIVMIWIFKGLWQLVNKIPWLSIKEWDKVLPKIFKLSWQIALEWITLWAWFWAYDVYIEWWEWTKEMIVEWLMMAAMYKLMNGAVSKVILKIKDGKVELYKDNKQLELKNPPIEIDSKNLSTKTSYEFFINWKNIEVLFDNGKYFIKEWENIIEFNKKKEVINYLKNKYKQSELTKNKDLQKIESQKLQEQKSEKLQQQEIINDIKTWKLSPQNFSVNKKIELIKKLFWWIFNKDFKSMFSWDKKDISSKLVKFVIIWDPYAKWENYNFLKEWNIFNWLKNIWLTWVFAYFTWLWALKEYYNSWIKIDNNSWKNEFSFCDMDLSKMDWKELAENYTFYGILNRFIWTIYFFNELWTDLQLYNAEIFEFLKIIPSEWVKQASKIPWLWENLKNVLNNWFVNNNINNTF